MGWLVQWFHNVAWFKIAEIPWDIYVWLRALTANSGRAGRGVGYALLNQRPTLQHRSGVLCARYTAPQNAYCAIGWTLCWAFIAHCYYQNAWPGQMIRTRPNWAWKVREINEESVLSCPFQSCSVLIWLTNKKLTGWLLRMGYFISLYPLLFKNIAYVWSFRHSVFAFVFVFVFALM